MKEVAVLLLILLVQIARGGNFWHITDLHLDKFYNVEKGDPEHWCHKSDTNGIKLWRLGDYHCDAPFELVRASIKSMHDIDPNPDFILWTGDSSPHYWGPSPDWDYIYGVEQNIVSMLTSKFPNTLILPVMGNHDTSPIYYFPDSSATDYYERFLTESHWNQLITDKNEQDQFSRCGFYKRKTPINGLTFLLLNTNIYYYTNITGEDPCGQFKWIEDQLKEADDNSIFIVAHVPPGYFERNVYEPFMISDKGDVTYNDVYSNLLIKYGRKIYAQLYGHTHTDSYRLFTKYNPKLSTTVALIAPSVTPLVDRFSSSNPSIRHFSYDPKTSLLDYTQYYLDLDAGTEVWKKAYSFVSSYGVADLSLKSLIKFFGDLENDREKFDLYYSYNTVLHKEDACNATCRRDQLCTISQVTIGGMEDCRENKYLTNSTIALGGSFSLIMFLLIVVNSFYVNKLN